MTMVITCEVSPSGGGKLSPAFYLPKFSQALAERGVIHRVANTLESLSTIARGDQSIVVLIYNETRIYVDRKYRALVAEFEDRSVRLFGADSIVHPLRVGRAIGDKVQANRWLTSAGVPMPRLIEAPYAAERVFSNLRVGSHQPVLIVEAGQPLDQKRRYNTEIINTQHSYRGYAFHLSLRAMCVGRKRLSVYVRARPVHDGDPSVHAVDTPVDAEMLNQFYAAIVVPRLPAIDALCDRLGDVLGLGFFAHDILPERETEKVYLCETGFKLDDGTLRNHLKSLRGKIAFSDGLFESQVDASANALLTEADKRGMLRPRQSALRRLSMSISKMFRGHLRGRLFRQQ